MTDQPVLQELIEKSHSNIDNAITSVLETHSKLGTRLNTIKSTDNLHLNAYLGSQKLLSDLESPDHAEAVSCLSFQSMMLEAAQQSFAKISTLSLFNKL